MNTSNLKNLEKIDKINIIMSISQVLDPLYKNGIISIAPTYDTTDVSKPLDYYINQFFVEPYLQRIKDPYPHQDPYHLYSELETVLGKIKQILLEFERRPTEEKLRSESQTKLSVMGYLSSNQKTKV